MARVEVPPALLELKLLVAESADSSTLLARAVSACYQALDEAACSIWLYDPVASKLRLAACQGYGSPLEELRQSVKRKLGLPDLEYDDETQGVTWYAFKNNCSIHYSTVSDMMAEDWWRGRYDEVLWGGDSLCQAYYATPIPGHSGVGLDPIGVLKCEYIRAGADITAEKQQLLEVIAALIGFILDNTYAEAFLDAARALRQPISDHAYNRFCEISRKATRAEACSLFLYEAVPEECLVMVGDAGHDYDFVTSGWNLRRENRYYRDEGLTWRVFESQTPYNARSTDEVQDEAEGWRGKLWSRQWKRQRGRKVKPCYSVYIQPISAGGKSIGILKVENKLPYTGAEASVAATIGFTSWDMWLIKALAELLSAHLPTDALDGGDEFNYYPKIFGEPLLKKVIERIEQDRTYDAIVPISTYGLTHKVVESVCRALLRGVPGFQPHNIIAATIRSLVAAADYPSQLADLYTQLESYETILFRQPGYRDHTIHVFNVYLLGYHLLRSVPGMRTAMETTLSAQFGGNVDVDRAWLLAALFHDIGYPGQYITKWTADFLSTFFKLDGLNQSSFQSLFSLDFLKEYAYHMHWMTLMDSLRSCIPGCDEYYTDLHDIVIDELYTKRNHGLLSSLILCQQWTAVGKDRTDPTFKSAISAIAIHDSAVWSRIVDVRSRRSAGGRDAARLSGAAQPLAFLLAYCDNTQEWGRPRGRSDKAVPIFPPALIGLPELERLDTSSDRVSVLLRYPGIVHPQFETMLKRIYRALADSWSTGSPMVWQIVAEWQQGRQIAAAGFERSVHHE